MKNKQNAQFTYKGNLGIGRHDWIRLTPAYSVNLIKEELMKLGPEMIVLDPFSGSGTTGLCAAELGLRGILVDVNPFLIWLSKVKTRNYTKEELYSSSQFAKEVYNLANNGINRKNLWAPSIHNIDRWWSPSSLQALKVIRATLDELKVINPPINDLLNLAFCRILIKFSNAAFNHQSMSFSTKQEIDVYEEKHIFSIFLDECEGIIKSASNFLPGSVIITKGDSRSLNLLNLPKCDLIYTSPPYVNRMSYIRELRPYMYWLKHLNESKEAGELDWLAIGGTWGIATSRLSNWNSSSDLPLNSNFHKTINLIATSDGKHGLVLSKYVHKYFYDMWNHFKSVSNLLNKRGKVIYIIGNSTFFGHLVPAEKWYAELLTKSGFENCKIEVIRKRNSNKALYEYAVSGVKI